MKTSEYIASNLRYFRDKFDFLNCTAEENEVYLAYKEDEIMTASEGKALGDNDVAAQRIYSIMFEAPFDAGYFNVDISKGSALWDFKVLYPDTKVKEMVIKLYEENNE